MCPDSSSVFIGPKTLAISQEWDWASPLPGASLSNTVGRSAWRVHLVGEATLSSRSLSSTQSMVLSQTRWCERKRTFFLFLFCNKNRWYFCAVSDKISGKDEVFIAAWWFPHQSEGKRVGTNLCLPAGLQSGAGPGKGGCPTCSPLASIDHCVHQINLTVSRKC